MNNRIIVGMSGGIDSTVAALLLKERGYEVTGATLRMLGADAGRECEYAAQIADSLGIKHIVADCSQTFRENVMDRFALEYSQGKTPNPCIACNDKVKFPELFKLAEENGCDSVATGHYASIAVCAATGRYTLKKAADLAKDQTYFLYRLSQYELSRLVLPLGEMTKEQIRSYARERGLKNRDKPDSQDICFIRGRDYASFIRDEYAYESPPGRFVDCNGRTVGEHKGLINYTIGQRKGLGIALGVPMYVADKDRESNTVTLVPDDRLYSTELIAEDACFTAIERLDRPMKVRAKTRHTRAESPATVYPEADGRIRVVFDTPHRAIAPGQAVVMYAADKLLGGATIISGVNV